MIMRIQSIALLLAFTATVGTSTAADDPVTSAPKLAPGAAEPEGAKVASDAEYRIAFPSPYARMLGIETALKKKNTSVDWEAVYQRLARKGLKADALNNDRATLAFAIGVRLADGIIALMAKDEEKLLSCAKDARSFAQKLGIERKELSDEGPLLRAVEDGNWGQVFFEIGMMQQEIVNRLEKNTPSQKDRSVTAMVACGAWLQGVRYAVDVISDKMAVEDLSNMLRAAPLAARLKSELEKAPADVVNLPATKKSIAVLDQVRPLIDIKRDENIPKEKLLQIQQLAANAVSEVLP
jgi:hypothetical protein